MARPRYVENGGWASSSIQSSQRPCVRATDSEQTLAPTAPEPPDVELPEPGEIRKASFEEIGPADDEPPEPDAAPFLLTLDAAIETALQQNPSLVTLRQEMPVSQAALNVAGHYPHDPSVEVGVMPQSRFTDGTNGSTVNAVAVMQTVELRHQPRYRWQAGWAKLNQTQWNISEAELRNVAETQRRFFAVLYRRNLYELTKRLADLDGELLGVLQRRFDAGQATAGDVALGKIEARATRQQANLARLALVQSRLRLQTHLGIEPRDARITGGNIEDWSWTPAGLLGFVSKPVRGPSTDVGKPRSLDLDGLGRPSYNDAPADEDIAMLAESRPDVRAANAALRKAVAECKLASASRMPNLDVGPVYEQDEDKTVFWGVAAAMSVPVFGSRRALALQRATEVRQQRVALQQLKREAMLEVRAAWSQYRRAYGVVEQFRMDSAEEFIREVEAVEDLFKAGQTDLLRVYAVRSRAVEVRMDYLQAIDALAQAAGDLIEAGGMAPAMLMSNPDRRQP